MPDPQHTQQMLKRNTVGASLEENSKGLEYMPNMNKGPGSKHPQGTYALLCVALDSSIL